MTSTERLGLPPGPSGSSVNSTSVVVRRRRPPSVVLAAARDEGESRGRGRARPRGSATEQLAEQARPGAALVEVALVVLLGAPERRSPARSRSTIGSREALAGRARARVARDLGLLVEWVKITDRY